MPAFTLYGLDDHNRTVSTEFLTAEDPGRLKRLANDRLQRFKFVELWCGTDCIARLGPTHDRWLRTQ